MKLQLLVMAAAAVSLVAGAGFDGIPGDYCRVRTPEQCCTRSVSHYSLFTLP